MNITKVLKVCFVSGLVLSPSTVSAQDRTPLAALTKADRVYINRGHNYAEAICLNNLIQEIGAYGGAEAMLEFTINLDDGMPTSIESAPLGIVHTCIDGHQKMRDSSGTYTLQIYDVEGNPTMLEP